MGILLRLALVLVCFCVPSVAGAASLIKPVNNIGLLMYWKFDESSGASLFDSSGNTNTGTLAGSPSRVAGKMGGAVQFSGGSQYGTATVAASATTYTVSAWIRYQGGVVSSPKVAVGFGAGGSNTLWMGQSSNGRLAVSNSSTDLNSSLPANLTDWHHVTAVISGGTLTGYVDGVAIGSTAMGSRSSTSFSVGNYPSLGFPFNGMVDEGRIYNRDLTALEVAALYQGGLTTVRSSGGGETLVNASSVRLTQGSTLGTGLVGHWTFDGMDTQSTITDRSGSGNHGYFVGGATSTAKVAGKMGQGLVFDGSSTYVDMGDVLDQTGSFSISTWFKRRGNSTGVAGTIIGKEIGSNQQFFIEAINTLASNADKIRFAINGVESNHFSSALIENDRWYHVVATYDDSTKVKILYINGVYDSERTGSGSATQNSESLKIGYGRGSSNAQNYFNGTIDDTRIYNRVLTEAEANQLYLMGK